MNEAAAINAIRDSHPSRIGAPPGGSVPRGVIELKRILMDKIRRSALEVPANVRGNERFDALIGDPRPLQRIAMADRNAQRGRLIARQ